MHTPGARKHTTSIDDVLTGKGFEFSLSMDCEGTNFDKNIDGNIEYLERFLAKASDKGIATVLFITPTFAEALNRHGLAERLQREYRVVYGLHIHPDSLPDEISGACTFLRPGEEFLASYTQEEQRAIIVPSVDYLHERGIEPLQAFRGGCFSMNDDTASVLLEVTTIRVESHNPYREEYTARSALFRSIPVYALNRDYEFRLEFFSTDTLCSMLSEAMTKNKKVMAITHSYMLDPNDYHYRRDGIVDDIHQRLGRLIETIESAHS